MKRFLAVVLTVILVFGLVACGDILDTTTPSDSGANSTTKPNENTNTNGETNTPSDTNTEPPTTNEPIIELSMVDAFIEAYNKVAPTPITDAVEFDVSDKNSGHYRTEFRLGAFSDAIGKSGKIGDIVVDIVNCGWSKDELRVYIDGVDAEQVKTFIQLMSPIMDTEVTDAEVQAVLDYITEWGDANGKYYGNLCVTFNDIRGEFMIRTD